MVQRVALIFGVVFLVVGILGFFVASPMVGMFELNALHNCVHILFGIWGLAAARSVAGSATFTRVGGIIYIVLAVLGYIVPKGFGLLMLGGGNLYLHAVLGVVLLGASLVSAKAPAPATT